MDIEKLVASIPRRATAELVQQRHKLAAQRDLPGQREVDTLRDAIDRELLKRLEAPRDGWSKGVQGEPRYLCRDGQVLAVVYRRVTHGADRGDYAVEVGGTALPDRPRHVEEARELAESRVGPT